MDRCRAAMNVCVVMLAALLASANALGAQAVAARPNLLWFVVDDMSANFSCYGERRIATPHVDRLAREGTRFARAFATSPVCSPSRSALITGMYQTSIGAHHHTSSRQSTDVFLPDGVEPIPAILQRAGYYTCNGTGLRESAAKPGKTDYNFEWNASIYDGSDWSGRKSGQPFFMQVQLPGGKLRGNTDREAQALAVRAAEELGGATDPEAVELPPYYPRDPVLLRDWAAYLDSVRFTDRHVGQVLARLENEGLLDETLIIFVTDHGISSSRGKQFLYDEGTHVPLVMRGPGVPRGAVRDDLVELFDIAAVSLAAAGVAFPSVMQERNLLAGDYARRDAVFAARDRCGETIDRIRSVRTERFLYIRNFHPQRPLLQSNDYKDRKSILKTLRKLEAEGRLGPLAAEVLFRPARPAEELYAWTEDRWQVNNLAADPVHRDTLRELRRRLDQWIDETGDRGPESDETYAREMIDYLDEHESPGRPNRAIRRNIELMKAWAAEGK